MQAVKFTNWTDEDFSWKFDGVLYTFRAGETMFMESDKAEHFAKHLVDREMNRMNQEKGLSGTKGELSTNRVDLRKEFWDKCFPSSEEVTPTEAVNLNEIAKEKKSKAEPEFEDLDVKPRKKL